MFIYGISIFILIFIFVRTFVIQFVCKFCNVENLFKTKGHSICVNAITNVVTIVFSLLGYMVLVKMGV